MSGLRIGVIGAGSYVFTLSLLNDLMVNQMHGVDVSLMDLDGEMASYMASIGRRMAEQFGIKATFSHTVSRDEALTGADFVVNSAAVQLLHRYSIDREVLARHGVKEILAECGGIGGLSYALRQIPLVLGLARDMERLCPNAWLLNVSNPLPKVMTAVTKHSSIKALGFCNVAWMAPDGFGNVEELLGMNRNSLNVVSGGLNHFSWLIRVTDRWTGEDLTPMAEKRLSEHPGGIGHFGPLSMKAFKDFGSIPLSGDSHVGEYLPFDPTVCKEYIAHHGNTEERQARRAALREVAEGRGAWEPLMVHRAWERPGDVIHSLVTGVSRRLDMVNLPNRGAITDLPDDAVVEVPAIVDSMGVRPVRLGALPHGVSNIVRQVSQTHSLAAEAAVTGNMDLVRAAVEADPSVSDKGAGIRAIGELIEVHSDVLPLFKG